MLTKGAILDRTSNGLDVFKHYVRGQWRVGRNFLNPLYEDRKASCNIFFDRKNGSYRLKDFGNDEYSGDCFAIVGMICGLNCSNPKDFVEILQTINCDLRLGLDEGGDYSFVPKKSGKWVECAKQRENPKQYSPNGSQKSDNTKPDNPKPENPKKIKPYSVVQQIFSVNEQIFLQQYGVTPETLKTYKVFSLR